MKRNELINENFKLKKNILSLHGLYEKYFGVVRVKRLSVFPLFLLVFIK